MEFEFHLQSPCGSPSTQLWDFRQSTRSGNERECKKNIEKHMPMVMTSLLMSSPPISIWHRLCRCRYSISRNVVASSPSFSRPAARVARRACSQAIIFYRDHNEPLPLPPPPLPHPPNRKKRKKIRKLHNHFFHFLLGITVLPREIEDGGHAEFWE